MTPGAGFLSPYRVLDLTDHRGALAGHMFAQLGADVIQVEPPAGSAARRHPPFAPDWPEGDNSLYWAAYASGKRSVVCDPDTPEGLALLHRLVASADFLIESAAPADGRPDWLAPEQLAKVNPALIHVSITPFGLDGPKRDWADSEITLWAAGGPLLNTRSLDNKPLRISVPQAYHHAAADGANAALIAHFARVKSGRGQHIDISVQQSVPQSTLSAVLADAVGHPNFIARPPKPDAEAGAKGVDMTGSGALTRRSKWPVQGGLAELHLSIGPAVGAPTNQLFAWMRSEGALSERFWDWDWLSLQTRILGWRDHRNRHGRRAGRGRSFPGWAREDRADGHRPGEGRADRPGRDHRRPGRQPAFQSAGLLPDHRRAIRDLCPTWRFRLWVGGGVRGPWTRAQAGRADRRGPD